MKKFVERAKPTTTERVQKSSGSLHTTLREPIGGDRGQRVERQYPLPEEDPRNET